ncbi:MAG: ParB N-terminal domain-containing protein [Pseudomonadota bacterium]
MSKKRRVFDIDFDEPVPAGTEPPVPSPDEVDPDPSAARRGPMAAAIVENAEAVAVRRDAETAIRNENDALAAEHVRLKKAGLVTDRIALDAIRADKLSRDRAAERDDEIDELKASIQSIGLSNPIRVEEVDGGYELIQGYRRLTAFRELFAETGDAQFSRIPAAINARGEDALRLYRRMVDENMVRRGVSFGELAQLAISYRAQDPNVESYDHAVELLYASAGRQKRAYLKSFARLLSMLGRSVKYPQMMPRALGLSLVKRLDEDPDAIAELKQTLDAWPERTGEQEAQMLQTFASTRPAPERKSEAQKTAKTTFRVTRPEGLAKCTAADGRLELRMNRDFSGLERQRLELAVAAFFDALDD